MKLKILIGVITYEGEKYVRKHFMQMLQTLSFPEFDVVFVDNSGKADADDVRTKAELITKGKVAVLETDATNLEHKYDIYSINRNKIREHFLAGDWTHLFFVDSDMFLPTNSIEVLLSHKKNLIAGVYLNGFEDKEGKKRILPVLWARNKEKQIVQASIIDVLVPRLLPSALTGLGCALISRPVMEKIDFPLFSASGEMEDSAFFNAASNEGHQLWVDTRVQCPHIKFPLGDNRNKLYDLRSYKLDVKKK